MGTGDAIECLYKYFMSEDDVKAFTDKIYKRRKPLDYRGVCMVIQASGITTEQLQKSVITVDYYRPNLNLNVKPKDNTLPDTKALDAFETFAIENLSDIRPGAGWAFELFQTIQMPSDEENAWSVHLRFNFFNNNT